MKSTWSILRKRKALNADAGETMEVKNCHLDSVLLGGKTQIQIFQIYLTDTEWEKLKDQPFFHETLKYLAASCAPSIRRIRNESARTLNYHAE